MLDVHDIDYAYSWPVLDGVSFEMDAGDVLALLGPNGSGKTTLVKILVGILRARGGSAILAGKDLFRLARREAARLIGYVAQESTVRFPLTAMEFVLQGR